MLAVISANVRLYQMTAGELRAVGPVFEMLRVVGGWRVDGALTLAPAHPRAKRRIVIKAEIGWLAAELIRQSLQKSRQRFPECVGVKPCVHQEWGVRPAKLPGGDGAANRE